MTPKATSPVAPQRGRPRDPRRMQRVIGAAQQAFLSHGYERTSIDAVARTSGVSKVTIYSYFANKQALYAAAMHAGDVTERAPEAPVQLDPSKPRDGLTFIGQRFLKFQRDDRTLSRHRTIYAEAIGQPMVARSFYENGPNRKLGDVAGYMKACKTAGSLAIGDAEQAAEQFICLFFGRGHLKAMLGLGKPTAREDERLVQANVEFFLRAYSRRR